MACYNMLNLSILKKQNLDLDKNSSFLPQSECIQFKHGYFDSIEQSLPPPHLAWGGGGGG